MPKNQFDWFTVSTLWLGAGILAIKTGDIPLAPGAPSFLASAFWGYVPFALVTIYGIVTLLRNQNRDRTGPNSTTSAYAVKESAGKPAEVTRHPSDPKTNPIERRNPDPSVLPASVTDEFLDLILSSPTQLQLRRWMLPYSGKWMILELELRSINRSDNQIQALVRHSTKTKESELLFVYFDEKWEDHLHSFKKGDKLKFRAQINVKDRGDPDFVEAIPL